jgi:hypothetical protein
MDGSDFKYKIKIDLIRFALTFILGGAITFSWQSLDHKFTREAELRDHKFAIEAEQKKYEKTQATEVFEESSKMLGKVIIDFQLSVKGVDDSNSALKQAYFEWKENFTKNKVLLEEYFGKPASETFDTIDNRISSLFEEFLIPPSLERNANSELETKVNELDNNVFELNFSLIKALLNNKIGTDKE